jgi:PleD family two-component response regulator
VILIEGDAIIRDAGNQITKIAQDAVSLGMRGFDGLRLCSQLRSLPEGRNVPILVIVSDGDRRKLAVVADLRDGAEHYESEHARY